MSKYEQIKSIALSMESDHKKFENGVKTSGQKVRASLLQLKKLCDLERKDIMTKIKDMPIRTRTKKEDTKKPKKVVIIEPEEDDDDDEE